MNPLCPNCQTELKDDFGLVDCLSCGAVCLIDLEDNVVVQGDESPMQQQDDEDADYSLLEPEPENLEEDELEEETLEEEDLEAEEESQYDESGLIEDEEESDDEDPVEEDLEAEEESQYDESGLVEDDPLEGASMAAVTPLSGEDFLKDLEVFSEEATADGGHIYYDFHVNGIEGGQSRENFIETLADSRLEISEDAIREILGDSSDFTLPQISFLRLTVIYKRLLSLELEMSWTLSELQEPASYLSEEIEEVDLYGEDDVVYEEPDDEY